MRYGPPAATGPAVLCKTHTWSAIKINQWRCQTEANSLVSAAAVRAAVQASSNLERSLKRSPLSLAPCAQRSRRASTWFGSWSSSCRRGSSGAGGFWRSRGTTAAPPICRYTAEVWCSTCRHLAGAATQGLGAPLTAAVGWLPLLPPLPPPLTALLPAAAAPHSPAAALQDESGPAGRCHRVREAAGPYEGPGCRSLLAELQRCRLL